MSGREAGSAGPGRGTRSTRAPAWTPRKRRARRRGTPVFRHGRRGFSARHVGRATAGVGGGAQRFTKTAARGARDVPEHPARRRDDPSNTGRGGAQRLGADVGRAGNGAHQHITSDPQRAHRHDLDAVDRTDEDTRNDARVHTFAHCRPPRPAPIRAAPARASACASSVHGHADSPPPMRPSSRCNHRATNTSRSIVTLFHADCYVSLPRRRGASIGVLRVSARRRRRARKTPAASAAGAGRRRRCDGSGRRAESCGP